MDEFFKRGLRQLKNWIGNNPSNSSNIRILFILHRMRQDFHERKNTIV